MEPPPLTLLLIEDNPVDARLIEDALTNVSGTAFQLEWVDRLAEGLERLAAGGIDVVLLDLSLPDSHGLDTFTKVHAQVPEVPILVLTGLEDEATAVQTVQQGAQDYLSKAYVVAESHFLLRAVRYAIERKRTEEELRKTNQTLRTLIHASPLAIISLDREGIVKLWNPAAERMFGWTEPEVRDRPLPIVPMEQQQEFRGLLGMVLQGKGVTGVEVRHQKKDGAPVDLSISAAPLSDAKHLIVGTIAVVTDITERKQAERELARLASFAEQNPNPIIELDPTGHVTYLNAAAAQQFPDLSSLGPRHPFLQGLGSVVSALQGGRETLFVREVTLGTRVYEQHLSHLQEDGRLRIYMADITERKHVERLKDEFMNTVSHELRTPLATLKEFSAILADGLAGPTTADQQEYLKIMRGNIDRLGRIIHDLLDLSKIEAGHMTPNRCFLEVLPLVQHVVETMRPVADHKALQLETSLHPDLPGVFADPDKVIQVLLNLVSNAIKFTPQGGRVTIAVDELENEVRWRVSDTGIGIDPADLPKLFEKFHQLHRISDQGGAEGTGLGLAISKRLVELHGGRIWAESHVGTGSTFSFTLPKYHVGEVFKEYLKTGIRLAKQKHGYFSILVLAIEEFNRLRARSGPDAVDRLLKEIEQIVQATVRQRAGDVVVRWQEGETVVVLAEVSKAGSLAIAKRLKQMIEGRTYRMGHTEERISLITALVTYPDEAQDEEELLRVAEERLHRVTRPKPRLLVVDDEPKVRKLLKEALELRDFEILTSANGPEAFEQLKAQPVDLILLDILMPVMDGYQVYHLLKENPRTKEIPVIMITGKGERTDRLLGIEGPSYNYVLKPFQLEDLLTKIQEVLQQTSHR